MAYSGITLQAGGFSTIQNKDHVITGGGVIMVDPDGNELYRYFKNENDEKIRKKALLACPMEHTTVMFRKESVSKAGCYGKYLESC